MNQNRKRKNPIREVVKEATLNGGDPFGDSPAGPLYRCPDHGVILPRYIVWRRDGKPYCPDCTQALTEVKEQECGDA